MPGVEMVAVLPVLGEKCGERPLQRLEQLRRRLSPPQLIANRFSTPLPALHVGRV
ncbi:MAG: hypothetical protein ABWW70_02630 [Thermoproteota archaeon]